MKVKLLTIWLGLLFFLLLPSSMCFAEEPTTVEMSVEDLKILADNCKASETALTTSLTELEEARSLLKQSATDLNDLTDELTASEQTCNELKQELVKLKAESARLRAELSLLKKKSAKASADLAQAEKSLNDTEQKYQKEKKNLKRETRVWQIIAVVLGGIAIGR